MSSGGTNSVACLPVLASLLAVRAFRSYTSTQWLNSANLYAKKIPHRLGRGIKDSIFAMDQGGSNIASGGR